MLNGKPNAYPFTADMCCLVTDGGAAVVLTTAERAHDLRRTDSPVRVIGSGERVHSAMASQMPTATEMFAVTESGRDAFRTSGLGPGDIDHLMIYDAFASIPLYGLENLGFVGPGESGAFIADGHTRPGGSLPMNTNGGGLNYTHTGMFGMFAIVEAVRPAAWRGRGPGAGCAAQLRPGHRPDVRRGRQPGPHEPAVRVAVVGGGIGGLADRE